MPIWRAGPTLQRSRFSVLPAMCRAVDARRVHARADVRPERAVRDEVVLEQQAGRQVLNVPIFWPSSETSCFLRNRQHQFRGDVRHDEVRNVEFRESTCC